MDSAPLAMVYKSNEHVITKTERWAVMINVVHVDFVNTMEEAMQIAEVKIMTGAV